MSTSKHAPAQHTPVLIVGGGPVGLGLAIDLGWRGIGCILVEQGDGTIAHPRANAENARTMELFRRWGIADTVRAAGTPEDFPHSVLYLTSLTGFEIARINRPGHGGRAPTAISPERPQRCNQLWLDPILRERARSLPSVDLRLRCRFESFEQNDDGVVATVQDVASGERMTIAADYLVACCGGHSSIPKTLGIEMHGTPTLEYNLNIFFRTPELWAHHDKGKAALHFFVDAQGIWRTLVQLDGRELWRLGLRGKQYFDDAEKLDASALLTGIIGKPVPHQVVSSLRWIARDLVADKYGAGRVLLAGDAAHQNTPSGGFGLNTGMGDVANLGWKLAAMVEGWGGSGLLASYEAERRPVAERIVKQATGNFMRDRKRASHPQVAEDSAEGVRARREMGEEILASQAPTAPRSATSTSRRRCAGPTARRQSKIRSWSIVRRRDLARGRRMRSCRTDARRLIFTAGVSCCCGSAMMRRAPIRSRRRLRAAPCRSQWCRSPIPGSPRSTSANSY
jgi:2-polyprenyl-6-methoxyphenol hydroxylase-like FAD-dependent oxidoreductase